MKKNGNDLVKVEFDFDGIIYTALVYKKSTTAILLPNMTVLLTASFVHTSKHQREEMPGSDLDHNRNIFDGEGNLLPLDVLYQPGDWIKPLGIHFPLVLAKQS